MDIIGDMLRRRINYAVLIDDIFDTGHVVAYGIKLCDGTEHILVTGGLGHEQGIILAGMNGALGLKIPGTACINIRRDGFQMRRCPAVNVH